MADWQRTFRVIWFANLITSIGMMSFLPFFPSLLEELGVEDERAVRLWSGVLFGAAPLGATLMSPVWGALGDRIGRKVMICRAMLAIAVFVGGMAFAVGPWSLLALRLGQGLFSGFIPPGITLVSVQAPADRQARVTSALSTSLALGSLIGPLMGGWLSVALGGHQAVFLFVGASALTAAVLVALFAREDRSTLGSAPGSAPGSDPATAPAPGSAAGVAGALRSVRRDVRSVLGEPALRATAGLVFAVQFGLGAANPILERLVATLVGGADEPSAILRALERLPLAGDGARSTVTLATSVAFGAMALANLVSLPFWGRYGDRVGARRALVLSAVLCAVALVWQAVAPGLAHLLAARVLFGAATAGIGPLAFGLAAGEVEAGRRGGAFGVVFSARTAAVAVGGSVGGAVAAGLGLRWAIAVGALCVVLGLAGFLRGGGARRV
ncbi:MAG: MFS transporter [Planctomycetes bacterium]|nr:MFS transporter [Planctomycetota bacterium]